MGEWISEAADVPNQQGSGEYLRILESEATFRVVLDEGGTGDAVHSLGGFIEGGGAARLLEEILGGDASEPQAGELLWLERLTLVK